VLDKGGVSCGGHIGSRTFVEQAEQDEAGEARPSAGTIRAPVGTYDTAVPPRATGDCLSCTRPDNLHYAINRKQKSATGVELKKAFFSAFDIKRKRLPILSEAFRKYPRQDEPPPQYALA
jgi:hypothetical protein